MTGQATLNDKPETSYNTNYVRTYNIPLLQKQQQNLETKLFNYKTALKYINNLVQDKFKSANTDNAYPVEIFTLHFIRTIIIFELAESELIVRR